MASYSALLGADGAPRLDQVLRDDGVRVLTGTMPDGTVLEPVDLDDDAKAYQAWLAAGGKLAPAAPKPREAYGDDLITALSDAELSAMSGGTLRDQRMLSAQRVPFRATDDLIVRLAAVMKIDPAAWFARLPA